MTWTDEELAHERDMMEDGESRYYSLVQKAREKDELTLLPSGRAALRASIEPVAVGVREWIEKANKGPGPMHDIVHLVEEVRPEVSAMLAMTVVVDGLHRPRRATAVCFAVGRAIEDEVRFREFIRREPKLWLEIKHKTKKSTPAHRRRVMVARGKKSGSLPPPWTPREKARVGSVLAEIVRERTGLTEVRTVNLGPRRRALEIIPSPEALVWLENADERAAMLSPLYMPTLIPPAEWDGPEGGGYHTNVVLRRPIARFRGKGHRELVDKAGVSDPVLRSLNKLQNVQWKVNEDLLEVILGAPKGAAFLPDSTEEDIPPKPPNIKEDKEARVLWRRAARRVRDRNVSRRSRAISVIRNSRIANRLRDVPLYFPHRLDFRGREYPIPHWLSPQGEDHARALLQFEEGCPATPEAVEALAQYASDLHGDLPLHLVRPFSVSVYSDPLEAIEVWVGAEKPLQCLAALLEIGAVEAGDKNTLHTPVHLDASNNGLQLFALMTGDRELAEATNAIDGPNQPRDLYSDVAVAASEDLSAHSTGGDEHALRWVEALVGLTGKISIPRKCAKRPVMTLPYGVTLFSAQAYVRGWADEVFGEDSVLGRAPGRLCRYLADTILRNVQSRCKGAMLAMDWLKEVAQIVVDQGLPVKWTSPSGWIVQQEYRTSNHFRVRAIVGGAVRHLSLKKYGTRIDPKAQLRGIAPNFVHSVDAAIVHEFVSRWDGPVTAVHDSFGVLPADVKRAGDLLREVVADVVIDGDPLSRFRDEVAAYTKVAVPPPPRLGQITRADVLGAKHLYS